MRSSAFDEIAFFRAIHESGARSLLIGRRALVLLGLPVLTADYDVWIAVEDIERVNDAVERFDLVPTCSPDEARRRGRYALENDEHVDVLVARAVQTVAGVSVAFDDLWETRRSVTVADAVVYLPSLEGLILTKQIRTRPKDLEDIRMLRALQEPES